MSPEGMIRGFFSLIMSGALAVGIYRENSFGFHDESTKAKKELPP